MWLDPFFQSISSFFVNGAQTPKERGLNLVAGSNTTIIYADNAALARTDVTIASTGGSGTVPTGTGFPHITGGAQDAAARAINVASTDILSGAPGAAGLVLTSTSTSAATWQTPAAGSGVAASEPWTIPGLVGWYNGDVGVTTGTTFTWVDRIGTVGNMTQATSAKQPTYTATIGSRKLVTFNGTSAFLSLATRFSAGLAWTFVAFMRSTSSTATPGYGADAPATILGDQSGGNNPDGFGLGGGKAAQYLYASGFQSVVGTVSVNDNAMRMIASVSGGPGIAQIFANGALDVTGAFTALGTAQGFNTLGAGYGSGGVGGDYFGGDIYEVLVYNRALTTAELTELYKRGQALGVAT